MFHHFRSSHLEVITMFYSQLYSSRRFRNIFPYRALKGAEVNSNVLSSSFLPTSAAVLCEIILNISRSLSHLLLGDQLYTYSNCARCCSTSFLIYLSVLPLPQHVLQHLHGFYNMIGRTRLGFFPVQNTQTVQKKTQVQGGKNGDLHISHVTSVDRILFLLFFLKHSRFIIHQSAS